MVSDDAFLLAIQQAPDDPLPRLIYADWLEEQGDPRAEYLRLDATLGSARQANQPIDPQQLERYLELEGEYAWTGWPWRVRLYRHDPGQLLIYPWFWRLLESAEGSLIQLARQLETLPDQRLQFFCQQFEEAKDYVHPMVWRECQPYRADELPYSESSCESFAEWVVEQGQHFFEEVRTHPERVDEFFSIYRQYDSGWDNTVDRPEYKGYQSPRGIAYGIYYARHGLDLDPWSSS